MPNSEYSLESADAGRRDGRAVGSPRRLRRAYFLLASLWGFATGAVALAVAAKLAGNGFSLSGKILVVASVAIPIALLGGFIAAEAYREARQRSR